MKKPPRLRIALPIAYVAGLGYGLVMNHWWMDEAWGHAFRSSLLLAAVPVASVWGAQRRHARRYRARQQELQGQQVPSDVGMT